MCCCTLHQPISNSLPNSEVHYESRAYPACQFIAQGSQLLGARGQFRKVLMPLLALNLWLARDTCSSPACCWLLSQGTLYCLNKTTLRLTCVRRCNAGAVLGRARLGLAMRRPARHTFRAAASTEDGTAAAPAAQQVRIETQKGVAFGQTIKAVGSAEALGSWDTAAAPGEHNFAAKMRAVAQHWLLLSVFALSPTSLAAIAVCLCASLYSGRLATGVSNALSSAETATRLVQSTSSSFLPFRTRLVT